MNRILFILVLFSYQFLQAQDTYYIYVGTFSQRDSEGIYVYSFQNGEMDLVQTLSTQDSPSFLAFDPEKKYLFSANRSGVDSGNPNHGSISAFAIDPSSGKIELINEVSSMGAGACHVAVNNAGNEIAVSNYGSGSVTWYQIETDGSIGKLITHIQHQGKSVNPNRQTAPHAHSAIPSDNGKYWFVSDLGMDAVITYHLVDRQYEEKSRFNSSPGAGPRHFTISPNGKQAYSIEELSSTIQVLKVKRSGKLKGLQRLSTLVGMDDQENYCADIHIHPSGNFIVGSNRGANTLASFTLDKKKGKLTFDKQQSCGGNWPRNFGFSPDGRYLIVANEHSDELVIFRVDEDKIQFQELNRIKVPAAVCVLWKKR